MKRLVVLMLLIILTAGFFGGGKIMVDRQMEGELSIPGIDLLLGRKVKVPESEHYSEENRLAIQNSLKFMLKKYPQARSFVMGIREGTPEGPIDITADMEGVKWPYFRQWDERWGYHPYSNRIIGTNGCGPTTLSMVVVGFLRDPSWHPAAVAEFSEANGYADGEGSSYWSLMLEGAQSIGLGARELEEEESAMLAVLEAGQPIIAIMGKGLFTAEGHFVLITHHDKEGFHVLDCMDDQKNTKAYPFETIRDEALHLWTYWY